MIRRHLVIERGGIRFGIFGVLGKEAMFYTSGGAVTFSDAIETAKEMVKILRETEKVDVVIALSHGGVEKGKDGRFTDGDDVRLAKAVPGIDVVIGGHSHTELQEAIIVNGRTPVVQTGKEGENLGELVITLDGDKLTVESYRLHPIDDTIAGDRAIADEIDKLKKTVTAAVFASRGYSIDQPLAIAPRDLPNTFTDIAAGTLLANLVTDAFRKATKADIGFTANGLMRAGFTRGKVGRANRLRRVRRGAPRRRRRGHDGRQRARDRLLHRPGAEESARVLARGQPGPPRRVFPPRLRHEVPLRPVAPEVRRRDGHRAGRPRSRLPRDRHHREGRAAVQPHLPADARHDPRGHPEVHQGQAGPRAQEQGRASPSSRRSRHSTTLATTRPTCCRRRARRTRAVSPPGRGTTPSARSRNGRRSWITSAACRSRTRANCP